MFHQSICYSSFVFTVLLPQAELTSDCFSEICDSVQSSCLIEGASYCVYFKFSAAVIFVSLRFSECRFLPGAVRLYAGSLSLNDSKPHVDMGSLSTYVVLLLLISDASVFFLFALFSAIVLAISFCISKAIVGVASAFAMIFSYSSLTVIVFSRICFVY